MNILVAVNDEYVRPLQVMLASLFRYETGSVDVYLFYSRITPENRKKISLCIEKAGARLIEVPVADDFFQNAPIRCHFSKEMYYRVLCSEALPVTLDRILYLDADILIRGSLRQLYEMDFQGKTLIGVIDMIQIRYFQKDYQAHKAELGLSEEDVYINSGVLLINLVKMREWNVWQDFIVQLEEKREVLQFPDQDLINIIFRGEIGVAEEIYNYPTIILTASSRLQWLMKGWIREKPLIVHYQCRSKPWHTDYIGKYYFEYQRYLRKIQDRKERTIFRWKHLRSYTLEMTVGFFRVGIRSVKNCFRKKRGRYGKDRCDHTGL